MRANRAINIVLYLLLLVAAFITIATYGVSLPDAPFVPVPLNGPTTIESNGKVTALADSESRRLMLLNSKEQLTSMIEYDSLSTPIEAVTNVCVSGSRIYVAGVKYQSDSDIVAQERVLAYDRRGAYKGIVYEVPDPVANGSSIKSLNATERGLTISIAEEIFKDSVPYQRLRFVAIHGRSVEEIDKTDRFEQDVYDGGYSIEAGAHAFSTIMGAFVGSYDSLDGSHLGDHVFSATDIADDGMIYAYDETEGAICCITPEGEVDTVYEGSGFTQITLNGRHLSFCNRSESVIGLSDDAGKTVRLLDSVTPTLGLSTLFLGIMAARTTLFVLLIGLALRRAITMAHSGETEGFGGLLASMAVVLSVGLAVGYTSYNTYQELLTTRLETINAFAEYFSIAPPGTPDDVGRCADRRIFRTWGGAESTEIERVSDETTEAYRDICLPVVALCDAATSNGVGAYAFIYAKDADGIFYLFDTTREHIYGASLNSPNEDAIIDAFSPEASESSRILEGSERKDTTQYRLVPLVDSDGDIKMVIEIGSRMKSFRASVLNSLTERVSSLLVMMAIVYLAYAELRGCGRSLLSYRAYIGKDNRDALALLTRPFTFAVTALSSVDSVMTVLIARQLVKTLPSDFHGVMVAVPSVMLGIGLALGHVLYGFIGSKASPRRIGTRGAFAIIAFSCCAILAIVRQSFALYCAAKLMLAIPLATLYSFGYSLPRRADSKEVRGASAEGVTRTDTSAAAIGTVFGGYAAQILGNLWVYVLIALGGILMLVFAQYVFPKHMSPIERKHVRSAKQTFGFLSSRSILQIVGLIMFPVVLAGGYDSFMFPLFSSDLGMSTTAIHNISAFGKLIVYVMIGQISRTSDELDKWAVAPASVALIGLTFLVFSFNSTITWSVVVIALVAVFSKSSDGWKALWLRSAESNSFPRGRTVGMMFATRSMLLMMQPLILSVLLTMGERVAILVLGVVCVVCAIAFGIATKDSELMPEGWEPPEPPVLIGEG